MCIFLYNIHFEVNYHCLFGSEVYIVGNISQLGNWNIENSFKLSWNPVRILFKKKLTFENRMTTGEGTC